jgi:hypothetical protein
MATFVRCNKWRKKLLSKRPPNNTATVYYNLKCSRLRIYVCSAWFTIGEEYACIFGEPGTKLFAPVSPELVAVNIPRFKRSSKGKWIKRFGNSVQASRAYRAIFKQRMRRHAR